MRSTNISFRFSCDNVTGINFRFRLLVTWSSLHGRDASSHEIWCRYLYPMRSYWYFFKIKDGGRRHLGFGWAMGPPTKPHLWSIHPLNFFCHDRLGSFQVIRIWIFSRSSLKVLFPPPPIVQTPSKDTSLRLRGTTRFWALTGRPTYRGRTVRPVALAKKSKEKRQWQTGYSPRPPTSPYRCQSLHAG